MRTFKHLLCAPLLGILMTGCGTTAVSPTFLPPSGSVVGVAQDMIARASHRVIVQEGRVVERDDLDIVNPYCQFHVDDPAATDAVVPAGDYTITAAMQSRDWSLGRPWIVASGAGTDRTMSTIMELTSPDNPQVTQMICSRWGTPNAAGWVTIAEMQAVLAGAAVIMLAQ